MDNSALISNNLKSFKIKKQSDMYNKKTYLNGDTTAKMCAAGLNVSDLVEFFRKYEQATASKDLCRQSIVLGVLFVFNLILVPVLMHCIRDFDGFYFINWIFYYSLYFFMGAALLFNSITVILGAKMLLKAKREIRKRGEMIIDEENKRHSNFIISSSCCNKLTISPKIINFAPYNNIDNNINTNTYKNTNDQIDINNFSQDNISENVLPQTAQNIKIIRIPSYVGKFTSDTMKPETYTNATEQERLVYEQINLFKITAYTAQKSIHCRYIMASVSFLIFGFFVPLLLGLIGIYISFPLLFIYYTLAVVCFSGYLIWEIENANSIISKEVKKFNKSGTLANWIVEFNPDALSFFVHYINENERNLLNSTLLNQLI